MMLEEFEARTGYYPSSETYRVIEEEYMQFDGDKVTILHSVPTYEINRHGQLRRTGETERFPLYEATDWNYIRFNCGCMAYEFYNDQITAI